MRELMPEQDEWIDEWQMQKLVRLIGSMALSNSRRIAVVENAIKRVVLISEGEVVNEIAHEMDDYRWEVWELGPEDKKKAGPPHLRACLDFVVGIWIIPSLGGRGWLPPSSHPVAQQASGCTPMG